MFAFALHLQIFFIGGPRGQGQDKETIQARRNKTENKTRGANHNRRYMADRKRREF